MIHFYSTRNKNTRTSLEEAVMTGLASDGGLFMPADIPCLPPSFFDGLSALALPEIAFEVSRALLKETLSTHDLQAIIDKAMTFDAPLKVLAPNLYILELFHGPTLSFKDFGAAFMAQLMGYFVRHRDQTLHILVATSGDTGSAIAQAFLRVPGIYVWILYPQGKVSASQEKQLTTLGHNVAALEVAGTFDDCQKLVKQAFSDISLRQKLSLTSANSINIARLIPQSFYYFYAYAQLPEPKRPLVFSVPCGNFGNLTAGLIAKKMGLPVHQFVAATNVNDSVPTYLSSGIFKAHPSKQTLSSAMDVGNPSNFARIIDLYEQHREKIRRDIWGASFSDEQTESAMREVFAHYGYLLDPHGAVAYLGLQAFISQGSSKGAEKINGLFLETAHPAKFAEVVEKVTHRQVPIPSQLQDALSKDKRAIRMSTSYEDLRHLLLKSAF